MPWLWSTKDDSVPSDTYSLEESNLIEGISDDTILLVIFTISLICLWAYYSTRERDTAIHPDNQQDVAILRERAQQQQNTADGGAAPTFIGRPRQDTCPICLTDSSVFSVETNCGHLFCGKCIITFWKFQPHWLSGMNCPVCRRPVTVLLRCFTADEDAALDNADRQSVVNDVADFNRRFSGAPRTLREYLSDIPVLIPHILRQMFSVQGLTWTYRIRTMLIFLFIILYILSPLDIIPESVMGFLGLFDDLLLLFCAAFYAIFMYRQFLSSNG